MGEDVHKMDRLTVSEEEARILMCVRMTMTERQYVIIKMFHLPYKNIAFHLMCRDEAKPHHRRDCRGTIRENHRATVLICIPIPHPHRRAHLTIIHCREQAVVQHI